MHNYFCPSCGKALRESECVKESRYGFTSRVLCPACRVSVQHSGGMMIVLGLIIAGLGSMIMPLEGPALVIGMGFGAVGIMRLSRQFRAASPHGKSDMTNLLIPIAVWLCSATSALCAEAGFTWIFHGSPMPGVEYTYNVRLGDEDRWDSVSQETPPLAPGKALRIARDYINKVAPLSKEAVPLPFPRGQGESEVRRGVVSWQVSDIKLLRYVNGAKEEQWVYVVSINKMQEGVGRSMPRPDMQIPVRLNGTIPEPVVSKPKADGTKSP